MELTIFQAAIKHRCDCTAAFEQAKLAVKRKHEAMAAHNARMDSLWDTVKHASNLSLNRAGGHK